MVQATLDDEDVLTAGGERKLAAIGDKTLRGPLILSDQTGRQVHAFDASETETLESNQTVSASAKKLHNFGAAWPLSGAQAIEAGDKLPDFLLRRLETQISGFPRIGQGCFRSICVQAISPVFHLQRFAKYFTPTRSSRNRGGTVRNTPQALKVSISWPLIRHLGRAKKKGKTGGGHERTRQTISKLETNRGDGHCGGRAGRLVLRHLWGGGTGMQRTLRNCMDCGGTVASRRSGVPAIGTGVSM
jgi:hypothetical protein